MSPTGTTGEARRCGSTEPPSTSPFLSSPTTARSPRPAPWIRRLLPAILGSLLSTAPHRLVFADDPNVRADSTRDAQPLSKKEAQLRVKARAAAEETQALTAPKRRRVRRATSPLWAYSLHNREVLILEGAAAPSPAAISDFLRCRATTQHTTIPPELLARIVEVAEHFDAHKVMIVSGYRSPKFNLSLRKKGRQVAVKSQHTLGHAIDFYLPGVPVQKLYRWLREHHDGGVGYYPISEFVHIDTGRRRTWRGT